MTTIGFFSAVQHRDNRTQLLVRARSEADLVALTTFADTHLAPNDAAGIRAIEKTLIRADYPFRVTVTKRTWKLLLAALTDEVDYDNFKTAVAKAGNRDRAHSTYMNVWTDLHRIEREADAGVYVKPKTKNLTEA